MAFVVATLIILLQFKQIQSQYYEQQITTPFLIQSQYDPNCYLSIGNATSSNDHDLSGNDEKNVFFDCDNGGHYWLYRNGSFWRCSNCVGWFIYSAYTDYWVGQLQWDWSQGEGYNINLNQYNIKLDLTHSKFDPKHGFFISQSLDTIYIYNDQDYNPGRYCPLTHKIGTKDTYNKYISSSQTILVSGYEARADCDLNATSLNIDISFTHQPTADPSQSPSLNPSIQPSLSPSMYPSTAAPSIHPTTNPSEYPSFSPSIQPSLSPSSYVSTDAPSQSILLPSAAPSAVPTNSPLSQNVPTPNTTGMSEAGLIISKFVTSSKPTTNPTAFPLQTLIITIKGEDADNPPIIDLSSISKGEIIIGIIIIICCCISPLICASVCFYVYRKHHNNVVKMQNDGREQTETSITIEPRVDAIPFKHDECSKCALSIQDSLKILPALNDNYSLSTNGLISSAVIDLKQNITPINDEKEIVVKCMVNKPAGLVMSDDEINSSNIDKSKVNSMVSSVHTLNIEGLEKNKILPKYINNESGRSGMSDHSMVDIEMTTRMKTKDLNTNRVLKLNKNVMSDVTDISDGMYEVCGHSMEMRQTTTNDHTENIKSRKHSGSV